MNGIGWAVKQMQDGMCVRREGWNGKGMFLVLVTPSGTQGWVTEVGKEPTMYPLSPYVALKTADNYVVPWLCSQTDLLATDYALADE